jgi:hypothetical protein
VTKDTKEAFKQLVENNLDNMTVWLDKIAQKNPAEAMHIVMELSKRFVPTLNSSNIDHTTKGKELRIPNILISSDAGNAE